MSPEQRKWGLLGLLVGDALGVPYEFTKPELMPPKDQLEYEPPKGFQKAWANVAAGTWSDDGSQALCVLDALMHGKADERIEDAVGQRLLNWYRSGFMAVDGQVFDIGNTTRTALHRLISGVPASESGMKGERSHANGSLMRTLPIAFLQPASDDQIARAAMGQSRVTHAEAIPMMCCAFYCLWARHIATGVYSSSESWDLAFDALHRVLPQGILTANLMFIQQWKGPPSGSGYCIDSLHSAKQALDVGIDYESTVKHALAFGNDTDTTACIVGGLAGIKYQSIPQRWLDGLRGKEILDPILAQLASWTPSTIS